MGETINLIWAAKVQGEEWKWVRIDISSINSNSDLFFSIHVFLPMFSRTKTKNPGSPNCTIQKSNLLYSRCYKLRLYGIEIFAVWLRFSWIGFEKQPFSCVQRPKVKQVPFDRFFEFRCSSEAASTVLLVQFWMIVWISWRSVRRLLLVWFSLILYFLFFLFLLFVLPAFSLFRKNPLETYTF